jgi:prepilin-type N-terminal cleavage/methylation domain-containing protein
MAMNIRKRGFTLIEVLVALVITVASALLLTTAWSSNFLRVRKTALYNNVAQLLERKMIEIQTKYSNKTFTEIKDEEGNFGDAFPQYRWTFSVQPFVMPDMTPLLTSQNGGADQLSLTILSKTREIVNKAVLEATVTVYVKAAGKEVPFSVTTYFVDYNSQVNIGM